MPKTAFTVEHGFKFANAFSNSVINVPQLGIDFRTFGRCGGMAFASLDYWYNRLPIPQTSSLPADGTSLSTYISKRLDASLILNGPRNVAVAIAPDWPDLVNKGVARAMREEEFPALRQLIDQGKPWPIALVRARNIGELTGGPNIGHQVVAYGYEVGSPDSKVHIYDNNHPSVEHSLTFRTLYDPSNMEVRHSNGETWRCFFVESYAAAFPPIYWSSLGGECSSGPAVASWAADRLDVFARGMDNALYTNSWTGAAWTGWHQLGPNPINSDPAAVSWGPNRIDVFALGTDKQIYTKYWNGQWNGWFSLGGQGTSGPAVASWAANRLDVFVRGMDNALYTNSWTGTAWTGWHQLAPNPIDSDPAAVSSAPNRIDVFARGTDKQMYRMSWNGSGWTGWASLGGQFSSGPAVSSWGPNRLDVFGRGLDNTLYTNSLNGSTWSGWRQVAAETIDSDPAAIARGTNRIDVFARHADRQIYTRFSDGT